MIMRCLRPWTAPIATLVVALTASPLAAQSVPGAQSARDLRAAVSQPPRLLVASEPFTEESPALRALPEQTQEWRLVRSLLSSSDLRKLDLEFVRYELQSQFLTDPERDPFYDRTRDIVRGAYVKMYREILERQYPLDDLVDDALAYRDARRGGSSSGAGGNSGPSWRLRVAPRVAVGSHSYVGARLSLPRVGNERLRHASLSLRHSIVDDEWAVGLRYSERRRFLQLERVSNDRESGDRYTLTVAMRF